MIEPNILAFQNIPVLEAIESPPDTPWTWTTLAAHLGRDTSNTRRTCLALATDGLLLDPPLSGLTDAGRAQLAAYKRAVHGAERHQDEAQAAGDRVDGDSPQNQGRWPLDKFRRDPKNRVITPDRVLGMADTIEEAGDVKQPVQATQPDADGIRTIRAGERRWLGSLHLAETGRLPAALAEGLPFIEVEDDEATAAVIALIENSSRVDLTPWEDARALKRVADALDIQSPTELARRMGRSRDQDRGGVRDVQVKLKTAREATAEAIAAYEADPDAPGAWETLRNSVSTPKPKPEPEIVLTKAQRLALAELHHKAGRIIGKEAAILPVAHSAEGARLTQYNLAVLKRDDKGDTAYVTGKGAEYLQAEGLIGSLPNVREQLGIPPRHGHTAYTTEWLNTPLPAAAPSPTDDAEVQALTGIEPISTAPLTAADFGVPADFTCFADGKHGNAAYAVAAEWIEPGSLETFSLPHMKGQIDYGFPRAQVQIARIRNSNGWIQSSGYSVSGYGNHISLKGVTHSGTRAFPSRIMALATAVAELREGLDQIQKKGCPSDITKWTERLLAGEITPDGPMTAADEADPLVVNGVRHPNLTRANEARRAAGILPRQSNSGGGAQRAPEAAGDATTIRHPLADAGPQPHPTNEALRLIAVERARQVESHGWTPDHDDEVNGDGELAQAAAAYACGACDDADAYLFWPGGWNPDAFKPTGTIRDLVKAGALLLAEIERRQRRGIA